MAPHSSTLDWEMPWTEKPGGLQSMRSLRVGHDWATSLSLFTFMHWRSGNPLQCSCLENPRDGGAWWAAVSGVAQSRTRLKLLSSNVYVSMLFSQIIPPSPSPLCPKICSLCLYLLYCPAHSIVDTIFLYSTCVFVSCLVISNSLWPHSPSGSFVHGILQARILEWVASSFSRRSSWPRDWTHISCVSMLPALQADSLPSESQNIGERIILPS